VQRCCAERAEPAVLGSGLGGHVLFNAWAGAAFRVAAPRCRASSAGCVIRDVIIGDDMPSRARRACHRRPFFPSESPDAPRYYARRRYMIGPPYLLYECARADMPLDELLYVLAAMCSVKSV